MHFSENIWKTDLDWMIPHQNRMIILNFLTNGAINTTNTTPAPFHHPAAQIREYLEAEDTWFPFSPEFINYGLALLVYSVRYPAVFWNTNKGFSFLFSLQLLANSFQNLLALGGISIMYKVKLLKLLLFIHSRAKVFLHAFISCFDGSKNGNFREALHFCAYRVCKKVMSFLKKNPYPWIFKKNDPIKKWKFKLFFKCKMNFFR